MNPKHFVAGEIGARARMHLQYARRGVWAEVPAESLRAAALAFLPIRDLPSEMQITMCECGEIFLQLPGVTCSFKCRGLDDLQTTFAALGARAIALLAGEGGTR